MKLDLGFSFNIFEGYFTNTILIRTGRVIKNNLFADIRFDGLLGLTVGSKNSGYIMLVTAMFEDGLLLWSKIETAKNEWMLLC